MTPQNGREFKNALSSRPLIRNSQAMDPNKGFLGTFGYNENSMNVLPNANIKIEVSRNMNLGKPKDSVVTRENLDLNDD